MFTKRVDDYLLVRLERGEEIIEKLKEACEKEKIYAGVVLGIGAADEVVMGVYNARYKIYSKHAIQGDFEILNLTGNISSKDGEVYTHVHITLADSKGNMYGGHLENGRISATGEIFIKIISEPLERKFDDKIGLNLFDF